MKLIYSLFFYFLSGFLLLYGQPLPDCKTIYAEHERAVTGNQVCLDIKVKDFQEMLGAQFSLQWDTALLDFAGLENFNLPNLLPSNFGTTPELLAQGKLTFLWFYITLDDEGYSLPDDATIFTVCFNVKGSSGSFASVFFGESPAATELTGWPGPQAFQNFVTVSGGVFIGDFPEAAPLELLSSCSFDTNCDSTFLYTAQIAGGTPPYAYEWTAGDLPVSNSPEVLFTGAGRYQLKVTDANQQELFVELSAGDKLLKIEAALTNTLCEQNTGGIDIEVIGGSGLYDYTWSDNSSEASRTNLGAGVYGLTVTDEVSGCVLARQFEVVADSCESSVAELILTKTLVEPDGSICIDLLGKGLENIKGFDITFRWNSSIVELDNVTLLNLPGEENQVINYNENGNSFTLSRRYTQPVTFEDGATLFLPCFTAIAQGGYSDIEFDQIETSIVLENDSLISPKLHNGQIWIRSTDSLSIQIEAAGANPEDTVCLAVSSTHFSDITQLQYALTWDNSTLEFIGIQPGVFPTADSSGFIAWTVDQNQRGILTFDGYNPEGLSVQDGEIHYYLCFVARRGGVGEITAANTPYSLEGYNTSGQYVPVVVMPGLVNIGEVPPQAMLRLSERQGIVGEEICVLLTGEQFEGVRKMDLSMNWDTSIIRLSRINEGVFSEFALRNWVIDDEVAGSLDLLWQNDSTPVSFFRPQELLELCFTGVGAGSSQISFSSDYVFESDNPSMDPMFFDGAIEMIDPDSTEDRIVLMMPDLTVAEAQSICVPVYAFDFNNIAGMQYTHHWDTSALSLESVLIGDLPDLAQPNFGFANQVNGDLPLSWTSLQTNDGVSLADSTLLYSLCFRVIGAAGEGSQIWIDGNPVPVEVVRVMDNELTLIGLVANTGNVNISRDFVWPGDTDHNGIANHQDLLNIGLAYGQNGPDRGLEINRNWEPINAANWDTLTPQSFTDFKHIDADGNGRIEASDTLAIVENWGKTTPWYESPADEGIVRFEPQQGAPLFVEAREEVKIGKNTFDVILGTEANPAEEVYGLAFSISYEYEGIQSGQVYAGFDSTWLGTLGDNLLSLQRNDPEQNRIDIAITRTDGQNISGRGAIASLHITIEDIILFEGSDELIVFEIENVRVINALELDQPTAPTPSSMVVSQQTTPTRDLLDERYIQVYPVPAREAIKIDASGLLPERMSVLSPQGTVLISKAFDKVLEVGDLQAGIYFLKLEVQGQSVIKPIIIIN